MASTKRLPTRAALCLLSCLALLLALMAQATSARADEAGSATPAQCPPAGVALTVSDLNRGLSVVECKLVGRLVRGRQVGAAIPPPGVGAAALADGTDGRWEELFVQTSVTGVLSGRHRASSSAALEPGAPATVLQDNGCSDVFQPPITLRQQGTHSWYSNVASRPPSLPSQATITTLRSGSAAVETNRNNCGVPDNDSYDQNWLGTTLRNPNINSSGNCTTRDRFNVTGFGALTPSGVLAVACTWYTLPAGNVLEGDVRFDTSGTRWWVGGTCSGAYDLNGVMTHERGHNAGFGHANETDHPWLTMSTNINGTCQTSERTFARGEANALNSFY